MGEKVAVIGLGVMGSNMAAWLVKAGHEVTVFNRTLVRADEFVTRHGGTAAPTPALAATGADYVFSCVGNDDHLHAVTLGPEGAFCAMAPGTLYIDHTTYSAGLARELSRHALRLGFGFLDAPVTGGQIGAEQGTLSVDEARRNGSALPVTALVDQFYADAQAMGGQRWDTSSLIARLRNRHQA